ncbi:hypothetical protein BFL40_28500 [Pseudomonas costantinii]|uniref:Uncharacterized protein n=1 Tax=Pseudomonas costantinii TaxID=168469 RepID=A0A1S2UGR8_9PSED|nr:hypothetical protein BFL40_28500 [Pseudomonas costantinii]
MLFAWDLSECFSCGEGSCRYLLDLPLVAGVDLLTDLIDVNTALGQCFAQNLQAECIPLVGAGLLANAVGQLAHLKLTSRFREQARSHIFDLQGARGIFFRGKKTPRTGRGVIFERHGG